MRPALKPWSALACLILAGGPAAAEDDPLVFREQGEASYYADKFEGRETASGATFEQDKLTAAHPELPLGAEVTVRNAATGETVEVEVNDRGPYSDGRDIDLSKAAAAKLGIVEEGVAEVEIRATKSQVEKAIDGAGQRAAVQDALGDARDEAAEDGTQQPKPLPQLSSPD